MVFTAVQTFLADNFVAAPVTYENDAFAPPDPNSVNPTWVYIEVYGYSYDQVSYGSGAPATDLFREEGAVLLHVMSPVNSGSLKGRQIATQLGALFKGRKLEPDIRFANLSIGSGMAQLEDGQWWPLTVRAEWARG